MHKVKSRSLRYIDILSSGLSRIDLALDILGVLKGCVMGHKTLLGSFFRENILEAICIR